MINKAMINNTIPRNINNDGFSKSDKNDIITNYIYFIF